MYNKPVKRECYFGIVPVRFVWHGQWADPELIYKRHSFNYWDITDYMIECWQEAGKPGELDEYISMNGDTVKGFLNDIIAVRKGVI